MSNRIPDNDTDFFGGLFDLNGDGRTDFIEAALMFEWFNETEKREEQKQQAEKSKQRGPGIFGTDKK